MPDTQTIPGRKSDLRARMLSRRAALSAEHRRRAASAVVRQGRELAVVREGAIVAGYAAIREELDPAELLALLSRRGHPIALPVVIARDEPLQFRQWRPGEPLEKSAFGVPVPGEEAAVLVPEVIFAPLAAFDAQGYRLGYGGGYYDRTLALLRAEAQVTAIGLAFDEQRVEAVPHDANDRRLDWMLTPSGVFATSVGAGD